MAATSVPRGLDAVGCWLALGIDGAAAATTARSDVCLPLALRAGDLARGFAGLLARARGFAGDLARLAGDLARGLAGERALRVSTIFLLCALAALVALCCCYRSNDLSLRAR